MSKEKNLDKFKYFLDCYFNISMDYADLEELAQDYKKSEKKESTEQLLEELTYMNNSYKLEIIQEFIREHGMRNLTQEKIKTMISLLIRELT